MINNLQNTIKTQYGREPATAQANYCGPVLCDWLTKLAPLFLTNGKLNQNQLGRTRFPALGGASYMHLLRGLVDSLRCLRLL